MLKRLKNKILRMLIAGVADLDTNVKAGLYFSLKVAYTRDLQNSFRIKYNIDNNFRFNGDQILFYGNGNIICGANSYIGNLSTVQAYDNCIVQIGNNCAISHNVRIYTSSNVADQDLDTTSIKIKKTGNVIIEDGVWIGANVLINPGITIGRNAIIGANSVVTKNIDPFSINGGVPTKIIRFKKLNN